MKDYTIALIAYLDARHKYEALDPTQRVNVVLDGALREVQRLEAVLMTLAGRVDQSIGMAAF